MLLEDEEGFFDVASPISVEDLETASQRHGHVVFTGALSEDDYELMGAWIGQHPEVGVRIGESWEAPNPPDLEFLRHFTGLRRLYVGVGGLGSTDGLRHVAETLRSLDLSVGTPTSLEPLRDNASLTWLNLMGPVRDATLIGTMTSIAHLALYTVSGPKDYEFLTALTDLRELDVRFGGMGDLSALPDVGKIEHLSMYRVRGLEDLRPLSRLPHLKSLDLASISKASSFPDMSKAVHLHDVELDTMRELIDIDGLAKAPNLERFSLRIAPRLDPHRVAEFARSHDFGSLRLYLGRGASDKVLDELVPGTPYGSFLRSSHGRLNW